MNISGDMHPKSPSWLEQEYEMVRRLGFVIDPTGDSGDEYARATDEVGLEYLSLRLNDPDQAFQEMPLYFRRFYDTNRAAGILNELTPEQFGLIVNIASLGYASFDEERVYLLHVQIDKYLGGRNSMSVPGLTAQIRTPELMRDMVAHWQSLNWPYIGEYVRFLRETNDWEDVQQQIDANVNNPVLFALTIPQIQVDPLIQGVFEKEYPELHQHGVDIIAARLYNKGAHDEILSGKMSGYEDWETTIYKSLEGYGERYRPQILRAIAEQRWQIFEDTSLIFPELLDKVRDTSFRINEDNRLIRVER